MTNEMCWLKQYSWVLLALAGEVGCIGLGFVIGGPSGALFLGAVWLWVFVNVSYFIVRK